MAATYVRKVYCVVEYLGKGYHGWQIQGTPDELTICGALTRSLQQLIPPSKCENFTLVGASRTDAGVNAKGNAFHIKLHYKKDATPLPAKAFTDGVNSFLGRMGHRIRVVHAQDVCLGFHAQRCLYKVYEYTLTTKPSVFTEETTAPLFQPLDLPLVRAAADLLTGEINANCFSRPSKDPQCPKMRTVDDIELWEEGPELRLRFTAPGFAWHQVRYMVGCLIDCGLHRLSLSQVSALRSGVGSKPLLAPSQGLNLLHVAYPPDALRPYEDDRIYT